jgi:hypothetical protein
MAARLLALARGCYPDLRFEHADLRDRYEGGFDVVVALMVPMDIPDLSRLEITIRPGGLLVATILHPVGSSFKRQSTMTGATARSVPISMRRRGGSRGTAAIGTTTAALLVLTSVGSPVGGSVS